MAQAHAAAQLRTPTPAGRAPSARRPRVVEQPERAVSLRRPTTVQRTGVVNRLRVARAAPLVLVAAKTPVVTVVDDVDLLDDNAALRLLMRFADELPAESQLVLVGRSNADLPLARLRAGGRLLEIGTEELRFTNREASMLFHNAD